MTVRFDANQRRRLECVAELERRSTAELVRLIVTDWLAAEYHRRHELQEAAVK